MSFSKLNHSMSWAGRSYRPNSLTTKGKFNPRIPSVSGNKNAEDELVWYDVPKNLKTRLEKKTQKITVDCIRENAESILRFYENDIVEHVLQMQLQSKTVRALIMRDHQAEEKDPTLYAKDSASKLAKSSYVGLDPFGDKKIDGTLFDEIYDDPADASTMRLELSAKGSLLKSIQDTCHRYARVHLKRILSKDIRARVEDMEREDVKDTTRLDGYHNKRRSWEAYRKKVLEDLLSDSGLHVLGIVLSLDRETGDTAERWVQRISIGRQMLGDKMGTNLSDQIYVELATRLITDTELAAMARIVLGKHRATNPGRATLTPARAVAQIKSKKWDEFETLVRSCVAQEGEYQQGDARVPYEERVFTYEQAKHLPDKKRARKSGEASKEAKTAKANQRNKKKEWIECAKCKAAGITKLRHLNHLTKDCKKDLREKRAKQVKERAQKARAQKARDGKAEKGRKANRRREHGDGNGRESGRERGEIPQCSDCKQAGRPHIGHDKTGCLYRKGGPWHGLKGEALKQAKRQRYEETRTARQGRRQSRTLARKAPEEEEEQSSEGPTWWLSSPKHYRRSRYVTGKQPLEASTTRSESDSDEWLNEERDEDRINVDWLKANLRRLSTMAAPRNKAEARSMMEVFDWLRDGVDHYADRAEPLRELLNCNEEFMWSGRCEESFQILRATLIKRLTGEQARTLREGETGSKIRREPGESEGDSVKERMDETRESETGS